MARQKMLPEMEENSDEELDQQCEKLLDTQKEKTLATDRYKSAHERLTTMMHERKITAYKHLDSGKLFQVESKEHVKHKNLKTEKVGGKAVNPDGPLDDDELDEPEVTGKSEIVEGLEELADEGPEGDEIKPKRKKKK